MEEKIGDRISQIIKSKGLNFRSLSKLIPYTDVQIGRIVKNESSPRVEFIQNLCEIFPDIDTHWLITGDKKEIYNLETEDIENITRLLYDNWDKFAEIRLFKALFESKAATWALSIKSNRDET